MTMKVKLSPVKLAFAIWFCGFPFLGLIGGARAQGIDTATSDGFVTYYKFKTGELQKLRWIEGTWRGTGAGSPPFFERYHFDGDDVLVMEGFADGSLSKVTESTRYVVQDGILGNGRAYASEVTDSSVKFMPIIDGKNSFSWVKKGPDAWTAILDIPSNGDKPARQIIYQLERWTAPAVIPAKP
jgi:hypothetical protein